MNIDEVASKIIGSPGYMIVPDVFDPVPLRETLQQILTKDIEYGLRPFSGGYRPDVLHLPEFQALMLDEDLLKIGEEVIGSRPAFGSFGANIIPPDSSGMDAHIDYPYFAMDKMPESAFPAMCMQMIWYLEDITEDFGPTAIVPESHFNPRRPEAEDFIEHRIPVLAKAGSLFVGHGALWHGVMPNSTDRFRPAILGSFVPFWVRPMLKTSIPYGFEERMAVLMCSDFGERIGEGYIRNSVKTI
jgi:hypothetical protein